jgi:TetR/AcrR family transcriptional regulator, mexCD-oprJ operon repressor
MFDIARGTYYGEASVAGEKRERALRSDSLRNRDAILEAAAECLTANPNASLADIAQAAGIARITLYGHFASRSDLLTELLHTTMARVEAELAVVDLSGDSWKAMEALLAASWRLVNSLSVLRGVVEQSLPDADVHGSHLDPRERVEHLLERGRADGSFRSDQSVEWQSSCYFALLHGTASEVRAGHLVEADAQRFLMPSLRALLHVSPAA